MKVTVAKTAGFCFGVERAVRLAETMIETKEGPSYSFGPVVHNEAVVSELKEKGLQVLKDESDLENVSGGNVLIRAHGVSKSVYETMKGRFGSVVDATCPFVKKIHELVRKAGESGRNVLIIGDPSHPEVQGISGWCTGPKYVIRDERDAAGIPFPKEEPMLVVVQTTFNEKKFKNLVEFLRRIDYNAIIADTICSATRERQEEAHELAKTNDVMLVIGSESSSNSRKLYDICDEICDHTYFIQTVADVKPEWFQDVNSVGITAGASTPKKIIEEVQNDVRV
ncbi:MAG: 4-hydroxy-3-methylbut-2-enyl diphosphate reductase [Lachnospiraceae bacterium]|nr:4-hydroxy-3-methylbut-2-enyl diphosphate reductase [Lachnospiraceae bacterium]